MNTKVIKDMLEKFNGLLSTEDLTEIETSINLLIEDATEKAISEDVEEMAESVLNKIKEEKETLTESMAKESAEYIKTIRANDAKEAANYITSILESNAMEVAEFIHKREEEISLALEEEMVAKIDSTIDAIVEEQISADMINAIALNETYKPIVEGMQNLLAAKHLLVDSEGYETIKESQEILAKQEAKIKELSEQLLESNAKVDAAIAGKESAILEKLILEKTNGLSDAQKKTIECMVEAIDSKLLSSEKLDSLIESVVKSENDYILNEDVNNKNEEESDTPLVTDNLRLGEKPIALNEAQTIHAAKVKTFKRLVG